jgi:phenylalanyl-tRNA synthetase beta chain
MKVSYNWLKEYVDFDFTPDELSEHLTMVGFEVEEVIELVPRFENIIVGKVLTREKHPNADKLSICTVDTGTEQLQVICGAPNVAAGQTIPFAPVGSVLPNGLQIRKAKIRGTESFGMICSEEELGLAEKSDGILELPEEWPVGADVYAKMSGKQDYVFDLSITPNRPDAMNMIGIAREVAAIAGTKLRLPEIKVPESSEKIDGKVAVVIENPEGCPRYAARIIKNVTVGPSPEWMAERLSAAGVRPINTVVDVTNYVLLELGQPLHAFDYDEIRGSKIIVRDSAKGEKFTTLDEKERELPEGTVMICDAERAVAVGGIMGGLNSEISDKTTDVLLESAYFTPARIGRSAKRMGLSSEASSRFERGIDPSGTIRAADRAAMLLAEVAGGTVLSGVVDNYPTPVVARKINFRTERVNKVLGTSLSYQEVKALMTAIEVDYDGETAVAPTFRPDLEREIDLIEEVARMIRFENIPTREITEIEYDTVQNGSERLLAFLRDQVRELGCTEVITNSMLPSAELKKLDDKARVQIMNPISDDLDALRPDMLPGLLRVTGYNHNRNRKDLRIFEIGRVFLGTDSNDTAQPYHLSGIISGRRQPESWAQSSEVVDFYDIKGLVESFLDKIKLDKYELIIYDNSSYFDAQQSVKILSENEFVGAFGKIKSDTAEIMNIDSDVFAFMFDVSVLMKRARLDYSYRAFSRFPYVEQDLAFLLDKQVDAGAVNALIRQTAGDLLTYADVFDLFESDQLGSGKKSLAFRLRFQSTERTLQDDEVEKVVRKIIPAVEKQFGAKLRD